MAYYVNRNIKLTFWEKIYIPEIIRGMIITSKHFFGNLFGFIPFLLGKKKERKIFTVYYPEETVEYPIDLKDRSQQYEIDMIKQALSDSQFNQKKTAEKLSLTYHQLRGYLKKYNLLDSSPESMEC